MFANCAPDFRVTNYGPISHGSSYVRRKLIYYRPGKCHVRAVQHMHGTVMCTRVRNIKQKLISIYINIKVGNIDVINININFKTKILSFLGNQVHFIIPSK